MSRMVSIGVRITSSKEVEERTHAHTDAIALNSMQADSAAVTSLVFILSQICSGIVYLARYALVSN